MNKKILNSVFKAYDIRGRYPEELSPEFYYNLGKAYATHFKPKRVVVGHDIRTESEDLKKSLIKGLLELGVGVTDVGEVATEMIYFATGEYYEMFDGGIIVTASHNPVGWNGCKMVSKYARPISGDAGLPELKEIMLTGNYKKVSDVEGALDDMDIYPAYKNKVLSFITSDKRPDINLVVDAGNGIGGKIFEYVFGDLDVDVQKMYFVPDSTYPNHVPNPMVAENLVEIKKEVVENDVELGIAIDGDADRVVFIDKKGRSPDGAYTGVLLANYLLENSDGKKIIHDPRCILSFRRESADRGAETVQIKAGHSFFKQTMSDEDALFGAEMSSHFYYRDFYYADSGMVSIAIMLNMFFEGFDLTERVDYLFETYPKSGEVNYCVEDKDGTMKKIEDHYKAQGANVEHIDGISIEFDDWRFNLRPSNTESLLRLNVESLSKELVIEKFLEVEKMIGEKRDNMPALAELR